MKKFFLIWDLIGYEVSTEQRFKELRLMFGDDFNADVVIAYGGLSRLLDWEEKYNLVFDWVRNPPKVGNLVIIPPALDNVTRNLVYDSLYSRGILDAYGACIYGYPTLDKETLMQSNNGELRKV